MLPDSLIQLLHDNNKYDKARIDALEIAIDYLFSEDKYDEAYPYIKEVCEISEKLGDHYGVALGNYYTGVCLTKADNYQDALYNLNSAKNITTTLRDNDANNELLIRIYLALSACFIECNMLPDAYENVIKGIDLSRKIYNINYVFRLKSNLAGIYSNMGKQDNAIDILKEISDYPKISKRSRYLSNLNLGFLYMSLHKLDSALIYFDSTYPYIQSSKDSVVLMNMIGVAYGKKKDHFTAKQYFKKSLLCIEAEKEQDTYISTLINLAWSEHFLGEYDSALILVKSSIEKAKNMGSVSLQKNCLRLEICVLDTLQKYKEIVPCMFEFIALSDSLEKIKNIDRVGQLMTQQELKNQEEQSQIKLLQHKYLMEAKQHKQKVKWYVAFSILVIGILIVLLFLYRRNILLKNIKLSEKALSNEIDLRNMELSLQKSELDLKNRELTSKVLLQIQNNELLNDVIDRLTSYANKPSNSPGNINSIIHELKQSIIHDSFKDFDYYFVQVHPDFNNRLLSDFPNLTTNELRMCAFLKLNLSTKDIAAINNVSPESVKSSRKRLRKTLNLTDSGISIVNFLSKYELSS
jgi:tetratricopeptide (TPR) repeat protein